MALLTGEIKYQLQAGRDPLTGQVFLEDVALLEYDYNTTTPQIILNASAAKPIFLIAVEQISLVTFAGGTPVVAVGDGTTSTFYIAAATLTANAKSVSAVGLKLVASAKVLVTVSGGATSGKGLLIVRTFRGI